MARGGHRVRRRLGAAQRRQPGRAAGLLAIRAHHRSRGEAHRTVCLVPSSAHGTNAASAVLAGLRVVAVATSDAGEVDLEDLRAKVDRHRDELAAIMVTYPSTHGVYEETITEVCDLVHAAGGQVYVDGANLNALVGIARPGRFGADVSHLNLHKTFCIPHGGGGPGVGPVAVGAHLAPFLPGPLAGRCPPARSRGAVGLGGDPADPVGLPAPHGRRRACARATQVAVLAANYVAARLAEHYPVLYTGRSGLVAHECILDLRPITKATGVTVEDVAKRLVDHGFHAPTVSFPVAGTLMVEPTESEDLAEIDRFCDAMAAIRVEIDAVAEGRWPAGALPAAPGAAHRGDARGRLGPALHPRAGGLPRPGAARAALAEVLAAGAAHRRRLRRPQPGLLLPAGGGPRRAVSPDPDRRDHGPPVHLPVVITDFRDGGSGAVPRS